MWMASSFLFPLRRPCFRYGKARLQQQGASSVDPVLFDPVDQDMSWDAQEGGRLGHVPVLDPQGALYHLLLKVHQREPVRGKGRQIPVVARQWRLSLPRAVGR